MIPNCKGCEEELRDIFEYCTEPCKFHYATCVERNCLGEKGHLSIIIVTDKGELVMW